MTTSELKTGMTIIFTTVPPASYATTGKAYRIESIDKHGTVKITSSTGGTFETLRSLRRAKFVAA